MSMMMMMIITMNWGLPVYRQFKMADIWFLCTPVTTTLNSPWETSTVESRDLYRKRRKKMTSSFLFSTPPHPLRISGLTPEHHCLLPVSLLRHSIYTVAPNDMQTSMTRDLHCQIRYQTEYFRHTLQRDIYTHFTSTPVNCLDIALQWCSGRVSDS